MELYYGAPGPVDFATALYQYCDSAVRKAGQPAVALLDYWGRDPAAALARVCGYLGIDPPKTAKACLAYPVPSLPPAAPAVADVLVTGPGLVVGVMGQTSGGSGRTVGAWLQRRGGGGAEFREKVCGRWVDLIRTARAAAVEPEGLPAAAYPLLRHTAAVCAAEPGKRVRRRVAWHQLFLIEPKVGDGKARKRTDEFRRALQTWADALRPKDGLQLWLHAVRLQPTSHLIRVRNDVRAAKADDRPDLIRRALAEAAVYEVVEEAAERLTPAAP
jgi:hypothetical protein